jgi:hypothetical protein
MQEPAMCHATPDRPDAKSPVHPRRRSPIHPAVDCIFIAVVALVVAVIAPGAEGGWLRGLTDAVLASRVSLPLAAAPLPPHAAPTAGRGA